MATLASGPSAIRWAAMASCLVAAGVAGIRWLRVAQREHYLPDATSQFAILWWWTRAQAPTRILGIAGCAALVLTARWASFGFVVAMVVLIGPEGLTLRGRTSPLAWTRRLRTLAIVTGVLVFIVLGIALLRGGGLIGAAAVALAVPAIVDLGCLITRPFERMAGSRFVSRATERLHRVAPRVVGITGSYGKTSTKAYVSHLAGGRLSVLASPASFNNRAGLARAVNEHLVEGTDVFVAEMGTYGPGEIADLCAWLPPDIAAITAIGPVHLERFGSEARIVEAKAEILRHASVAILNVDDYRLADLADRCEAEGTRVVRCSGLDHDAPSGKTDLDESMDSSTDPDAPDRNADGPAEKDGPKVDVRVTSEKSGLKVTVADETLADGVPSRAQPGNVAIAVAVAIELGVDLSQIAERLPALPAVAHRLEPSTAPSGCLVLDDTYNSNPAGAAAALDLLRELAPQGGRRVLVTPGMVELGKSQDQENSQFAEKAASIVSDLLVVGRTNKRALLDGARRSTGGAPGVKVHEVANREAAVAWVRGNLGDGDIVLYENDLPDNYP